MDQLVDSCKNFQDYPHNLIGTQGWAHTIRDYARRFGRQRDRLFVNEGKAALHFLQFQGIGLQEVSACNLAQLKELLQYAVRPISKDPLCRYILINAPSSRDQLQISADMLSFLLSYYQIRPVFLDFLFPTVYLDLVLPPGKQEHLHDIYFSALEEEHRLDPKQKFLVVKELGRSGQELRLCYNLRSADIDPDPREPDLQWTIKQTAVYHCFDAETGQSMWTICKSSTIIKDRMTEWLSTVDSSTLDSKKNWRWYFHDLEDEIQKISRAALFTPIDQFPGPARTSTSPQVTKPPRIFSFGNRPGPHVGSPVPPPARPQTPPEIPPEFKQDESSVLPQPFKFSLLQRTEYLEEKAQEAVLALKLNLGLLEELRKHHQEVSCDPFFPEELRRDCKAELASFSVSLSRIEKDLSKQLTRAEAVLSLIANRKNLLFVILQFRSMQDSGRFAKESQRSAENMEKMTQNMQKVANKTQQEALSMRIVTLVTLFFLPATSIATFLSTDIVKFNQDGTRSTQLGNLGIYLAICLPLTAITFFVWWGMSKVGRNQYKRREADDAMRKAGGESKA